MGKLEQGVEASRRRYHVVPRTLCFITHGQEVLLLRGAPDKRIWPNRYNGVGGHVERHEDVHTAALREIWEETGLAVHALRLCGLINVDAGDAQLGILVFVFTAVAPTREFAPSHEGRLEWIARDRILEDDVLASQMVEDLPHILPYTLKHSSGDLPFFAHYRYDEDDELAITIVQR